MSIYQHGKPSEYAPAEIPRTPETQAIFDRPSYAPTPLNPYDLTKDGVPYITKALETIDAVFAKNLLRLPERPPEVVIDALRISVTNAMFRRFEANSGKSLPSDCDEVSAELFVKACLGLATPDDLLSLLQSAPQAIQSVELAKQTIPFDWQAAHRMDMVVQETLHVHGFKEVDEAERQPRHYYLWRDESAKPNAVIIVRKATVGVSPYETGNQLTVVQRDSFVIDLIHQDATEFSRELRLWLQCDETKRTKGARKLRYDGTQLSNFIEEQLAVAPDHRSAAIYPGVRSYYAYHTAAHSISS